MIDGGLTSPIREDVCPTPTASVPIPSPSPSTAAAAAATAAATPAPQAASPTARSAGAATAHSAAAAQQELEVWKEQCRHFSDRHSLSPPRGATFGTTPGHDAAPASPVAGDEGSPGPGAYLPTASKNNFGQGEPNTPGGRMKVKKGACIASDPRWKPAPLTPGPGEYAVPAHLSPHQKRSNSSPRCAVFGSEPQRAAGPRPGPGPGSYGAAATPQRQASGGTFGKTRREAAEVLRNPQSLAAAPAPAHGGGAGSRRSHGRSGTSFGTSRRFAGPDHYAPVERAATVPGPGCYNPTARGLAQRLASSSSATGRSRTPPASSHLSNPSAAAAFTPERHTPRGGFRRSSSTTKTASPASSRKTKPRPVLAPVVTPSYVPTAPFAHPAESPAIVSPCPVSSFTDFSMVKLTPQGERAVPVPGAAVPIVSPPAASQAAAWAPEVAAPVTTTPGERAWVDFCERCRGEGLCEDELTMLSLDTLKALMRQVGLTDVVDAARVEVQWKQLRLARN